MKGKIVLIPVVNPVEGMQVVLSDSVQTIVGVPARDKDNVYLTIHDIPTSLSELKQIVISTKEWMEDPMDLNFDAENLPLHPEDWKYALEHIGEEVDFEINYKIGNPEKMEGFWLRNKPLKKEGTEFAKLIHSTPKMYSEEEVKNILQDWAIYIGIEENPVMSYFDWWDKYKKK